MTIRLERADGRLIRKFLLLKRQAVPIIIGGGDMNLTKKLSVLYAEDNEDSGLMLSTLLGFSGIDVSVARTVKEAVRSAESSHFDLFLLDSRFPDGSGFDLCRRLREVNSEIPVVFYTGDAGPSDKQKGMIAGAQAYLVKPEVDSVASTIFQCLGTLSQTV